MILKITMPNEDKIEVFTNFNKAIKFCEEKFEYGTVFQVSKWKEVKKSKDFNTLRDFLWLDGLWVELHSE